MSAESPFGRTDGSGLVEAAGGVLWRPNRVGDGIEVCLVHRTRYDDWSHPKGKLGKGEHVLAGAVREVREETGASVAVGRYLGSICYDVTVRGSDEPQPKRVRYWAMRFLGGTFSANDPANDEVDRIVWTDPSAAGELLSYDHDRAPLSRMLETAPPSAIVLLVRHGRAGDRDDWTGHDDLRPLDPFGARQAATLADIGPCFGITATHSAPLVRCTETVAPLARRLGQTVVTEPLFSEDGYARSPDRALRRLRDIAATAGNAVICSQGGAIPSLVTELSQVDRVPVERSDRSRKGSAWAVSFHGRRAVAADYYPSLSTD